MQYKRPKVRNGVVAYPCFAIGEPICKVIVYRNKAEYYPNWMACFAAGLADYGAGAW